MSRDYKNQIEVQFSAYPVSDKDSLDMVAIRKKFEELAWMLEELVPDGLEKSKAITGLNEPMFWAVAGIARATAYEALDRKE